MRFHVLALTILSLPSTGAFAPASISTPAFLTTTTSLSAVADEESSPIQQVASTVFAASLFLGTAFAAPSLESSPLSSAFIANAANPVQATKVAPTAAKVVVPKDPVSIDKASIASAKDILFSANVKVINAEKDVKTAISEASKPRKDVETADLKRTSAKAALATAKENVAKAKANKAKDSNYEVKLIELNQKVDVAKSQLSSSEVTLDTAKKNFVLPEKKINVAEAARVAAVAQKEKALTTVAGCEARLVNTQAKVKKDAEVAAAKVKQDAADKAAKEKKEAAEKAAKQKKDAKDAKVKKDKADKIRSKKLGKLNKKLGIVQKGQKKYQKLGEEASKNEANYASKVLKLQKEIVNVKAS